MPPEMESGYREQLSDTSRTLAGWAANPWPMLLRWVGGSALAAALLLVGTLVVAEAVSPSRDVSLAVPPVAVGPPHYVLTIFAHNLLVLALHSFACVAGFIARRTIPGGADRRRGLNRTIHDHGARLAIVFVIAATLFSLGNQVWDLGTAAAGVAHELGTAPALLLLTLLPHAAPELLALFLPLAAWVIASRKNRWDELLAAALVTTALAVPILLAAATWETYGAAHVVALVARR